MTIDDSLGNIFTSYDECAAGIIEMDQDYIDGKKELKEINMGFQARYLSVDKIMERQSCSFMNLIR